MQDGWQEAYGDLVGLLRTDIVNGGNNRPEKGVAFESMHPYPAVIRRRNASRPKVRVDEALSGLKAALLKRKDRGISSPRHPRGKGVR